MENLLKIAAGELGVKEVSGDGTCPEVLKYAQESGFTQITDDETPWCSIFVNWCCMKAGLQRSHKSNARSWLTIGLPTNEPVPGDIVIFWRESVQSWKGHVGIFMGYSSDRQQVFSLGGNQRNSVSVQGFSSANILGFRRLSVESNLEIPKQELKLGSRGKEVIKLQKVLHELGYDCGSIDGVFGPKTEQQLKEFQQNQNLGTSGIYDTITQSSIENIFQQ